MASQRTTSIPQSSRLTFDEVLAAEVVVEVDLVPGLGELLDALGHGLDPDRVGVRLQEGRGPLRVVVEEQASRRFTGQGRIGIPVEADSN